MNPMPVRCRLLRALELAPMTVRQASTCLSVGEQYARRTMFELYEMGVVREIGSRRHGTGRPRKVWEIAA